jgi:hypothetical protein
MFPDTCSTPPTLALPRISAMLPVMRLPDTVPAVEVMFPVAVMAAAPTLLVARLLLMMLPDALILAPEMLPLTERLLSVPTLVMLGCAAVVTVPAVTAEVAVPADPAVVAKAALATVPVTLAPVNELNAAPEPKCVPVTLAPVILPLTLSAVRMPTLVILGCALVVTVPAVAAVPADPVMLPVMVLVTVNPDNVPTDVILGCAFVVTVPAVAAAVAKAALATMPVTLAPVMLEICAPLPTRLAADTVPVAVKFVVDTLPDCTLPVTVMLLLA